MILEFMVENFLSIGSKQTLSFNATKDTTNEDGYVTTMPDGTRILKVAMIFGANATGKTNILRALDFFLRMVVMKSGDDTLWHERKPFKFDAKNIKKPTEMELVFYFREQKHRLKITFLNGVISDEELYVYKSSRATNVYKRHYLSKKGARVEFNEKLVKLTQAEKKTVASNAHDDCTVISAYYSCFSSKMVKECSLKPLYEYFRDGFPGLYSYTNNMLDRAKELVTNKTDKDTKAFLEDWMHNGSFRGLDKLSIDKTHDSKELKFGYLINGNNYELSENEVSDGAKRFLGLGSLIYEHLNSNCLIMVDGLDWGLHPKLRRFFLRSFLKNSLKYSQLIFTTNAYYILDREFIRRDTVWFTERFNTFETWLVRLSKCKIRKDYLVHTAYKNGWIVKLPAIGDHVIDLTKYIIVKEEDKKKPKKKKKDPNKVLSSDL